MTLVLVSGSGRSGTSSLSGSLARLGMHVPEPQVPPSPTNPRGFYEPQWVLSFHKGHLREAMVFNIDSRPEAPGIVADLVASGEPHAQLREWLATQLDHPMIVVKDPHAFWFAEVWRDVCAELGVTLKWLTALRHPAEVVGSRDIAYRQGTPDDVRHAKEISNVAGWVHATLLTEKAGRAAAARDGRSFIRYHDLLDDWRSALRTVEQQLRLTLEADLTSAEAHPVDDFITPSMRKSQLTWADLSTPEWLRDMAQEVWELLDRLVDEPADEATLARLDEIHVDYDARYAEAAAVTFDLTEAARRARGRAVRTEMRERLAAVRADLRPARAELRQARADLRQARTELLYARGREGSPLALPGWIGRKVRSLLH
ncbi:sulfotransferase family protein [Nocardioides jishulii]|uniref:Sulfotransferase family protein n=1 Tax=Nocardioides jishulii TaxID=2575440 RepID=A0A4U2YIV3_9ACTN|nr:sulfotransferase family protein [Nocardioides jishulii]QCX26636.1 sulfotransferase family protein [Nocardioides jishulii]TKI60395.1 sulfotransferase family protein [Nocardioides jishulii]